jgi:hypothetical protein
VRDRFAELVWVQCVISRLTLPESILSNMAFSCQHDVLFLHRPRSARGEFSSSPMART